MGPLHIIFFLDLAEGKEYWIGLDDLANEGTFVWATGENVGYSNWNDGELEDKQNQNMMYSPSTEPIQLSVQ